MRAIRLIVGKQVQIKWVNDLLLEGRKVCGILTEAVGLGEQTHLIVGVGINLRPAVFPPGLSGADYRAYSCVLGQRVRWSREGEIFEGVAESIDGEGGLTVRTPAGGTVVLRTGEISVRTLPQGAD